ncbi:MAG: hypothetical protein AB9856_05510 [Cellulosilyticaceae bacterium]
MAKPRRGKGMVYNGYKRGTCPMCSRPRVRLAWEKLIDKQKIKVCKVCRNK